MENLIQRLSYRAPLEDREKLFEFLDGELRAKVSYSVQQEYPSLFGEFPGGQSLYIQKENQVASHVGFVNREFQHSQFRMKIGLIGSVATAAQWRGMGMASSLMKEAFSELKRRGAVIAVLWSDQADFYLPLGFYRAGREVDLKFSAQNVPENMEPAKPFEMQKHLSQVWRLYQKHILKLDRSLEEQARLCQIPETQIFVTEKAGTLTSYIAINKGADFTDYIHEWAGEVLEVQRNVAYCQRQFFPEKEMTLIAPAHYDLGMLRQIATERWDGILGLIKVLDRRMLISIYTDYLKKNSVHCVWGKDFEHLTINGQVYPSKTDAELLLLILGDATTSSHPVLPFFLWGFDSI